MRLESGQVARCLTHDEIAELAFETIKHAQESGISDPLRLAHAVAYAIELARNEEDPDA